MKTNQINYMKAVNIYELPSLVAEKVEFLKSDVTILAEYGIDQATINTIEADATALTSLLMDQKYESLQKEATHTKNEIRKEISTLLNYLTVRVSVSIEADSVQFSRFDLGSLSKLTDSEFFAQAVYTYNIITENAGILSNSGINANDINQLSTLIGQFQQAASKVKAAIQNRRIATSKRHEAARLLYRKLVKTCTTARKVYYFIDPVYASRYTIHHDTVASTETPMVEEQV